MRQTRQGKSAAEHARGRSDPTVPQNRGPVPSGFGGNSRLLLLENAARVLAAKHRRELQICRTSCQTNSK